MTNISNGRLTLKPVFATTVFISAFLLFLIQPLISKILLPWFGGSTGVWATCLVFFQAVLCLGYLYAHLLEVSCPPRWRWKIHFVLLFLGLISLPVIPSEYWKPEDSNSPSLKILLVLLVKVGFPYLALSTTGPLLQSWYAKRFPESRTYRLYALSNVASLGSLLLFPFWFERTFAMPTLAYLWSFGFLVFCFFSGYLAWVCLSRTSSEPSIEKQSPKEKSTTAVPSPPPLAWLTWFFLAATASFFLVAGTNQLCQDIASTPFLWIVPLCLYLISFIIAFDSDRWYLRTLFVVVALVGIYVCIAVPDLNTTQRLDRGWIATALWNWSHLYQAEIPAISFSLVMQVVFHCSALFGLFMVCHGELAQRKPNPIYLTHFYLCVSVGGVAGSILVSLVAPAIFPAIWEWQFGLLAALTIMAALLMKWKFRPPSRFQYLGSFFFFLLPATFLLWSVSNEKLGVPVSEFSPLFSQSTVEDSLTPPSVAKDIPPANLFEKAIAENETRKNRYFYLSLFAFFLIVIWALFLWLKEYRWTPFARWLTWNVVGFSLAAIVIRDILVFLPYSDWKEQNQARSWTEKTIWRGRNFFGAASILEIRYPQSPVDDFRYLSHGRINHGGQFLYESRRREPSTYYTEGSGIALAIDHFSAEDKRNLGVLGLGSGSLAVYANQFSFSGELLDKELLEVEPPSDESLLSVTPLKTPSVLLTSQTLPPTTERDAFVVYEINPLIIKLSEGKTPFFSFLKDARDRGAEVEVIIGDGRISLTREPSRQFDVLAIDAFSGDAIPVHLLTREAMREYYKHLQPLGILAIHISNRYLDLEPVCRALAEDFGMYEVVVEHAPPRSSDAYASTWVLLTNDLSFQQRMLSTRTDARLFDDTPPILWTDSYSNLFDVLKTD